MAVEGSVPDPGVIVPHLAVRDAEEAVAFYTRAFGARVLYRSASPSGHGEHIHLRIWSSLIQLSTEEPDHALRRSRSASVAAPDSLGGTTCVFQIRVPDVDAAYRRALDNGGLPILPPTDMFWGDRYGWIRDPFGHVWALSTVREVLTASEVAITMRAVTATMIGDNP